MTKYSLDTWNGNFLSGHISKDNGETWQRYDPLVIAALMAGIHPLCDSNMLHDEVELKDNSVELTVWWKENND